MLLCRVVTYRPVLLATLRDDQRPRGSPPWGSDNISYQHGQLRPLYLRISNTPPDVKHAGSGLWPLAASDSGGRLNHSWPPPQQHPQHQQPPPQQQHQQHPPPQLQQPPPQLSPPQHQPRVLTPSQLRARPQLLPIHLAPSPAHSPPPGPPSEESRTPSRSTVHRMPPLTRSPAFRVDSGSQEQTPLPRPTRRRHRSPAVATGPSAVSKEDSRSTTVEEFAIPQKPVLARAGNVRQDTSILLTAPSSAMTPPAEQSFLPPVDVPPCAVAPPRPPSGSTQLELELDASMDCRSLDEAEAAQSQILEPPHSSGGSSAEAALALQQSHRSAKMRALSGKQQAASPQPQLEQKPSTAPTPTPAAVATPTATPPPAATPTPAPAATPPQAPAATPPAAEQPPDAAGAPAPQEPPPPPPEARADEPEAESVAEPALPPPPAPTPAPAPAPALPPHAPTVTRPPVIDLRLDVEGPPQLPGASRRAQLAGRRPGATLVKPAAANGRGTLTSRSSVAKGGGRVPSQLQLQAQSQQVQLFPPALPPVDTPRESLNNCLHNLESHEWEQVVAAMPVLVRLMRHHPDSVLLQAPAVAAALSRHVRNLRSQVARAACQASGEFFVGLRRTPELDVEELVGSLFHRSADTNKFLRADCNAALDKMAEILPPARAVQLIVSKGASHQNAVVRTVAARLLAALTARLGADRVLSAPRELRNRLLLTGASLLTEGSLDTRCHAKSMFRHLVSHPNFASVLSDVVPQQVLRNISKTLQSLK